MPLRDLFVFLVVFASLPMILMRPVIGVLVWSWIGYMNPHRLTWGFAYDFPFAQLIAMVTFLGIFLTAGKNRYIPGDRLVYVLILFNLWMVITTFFAIYPDYAWTKLEKVLKVQVMTFVTLMLVKDRRFLHSLIWIIVISVGFYGVKGGVFTLLTGGQNAVLGPADSFFEGNTNVALALLMILPLMRYIQLESQVRWVRWGLVAAMALTGISVLGTYSRGAFLGAAAMGLYWVWKTPYRARFLFAGTLVMALSLAIFPQKWYEEMESIGNYQQDRSAMGRIYAWQFTLHMVAQRPIFGGGFDVYTRETYDRFAPEVSRKAPQAQGPHSNYFKPLGEHGFPGLILYLATGILAFRRCGWIIRQTQNREDLRWARNLAAMIQVGLVGYAVSGAFLGMTYFDLYYHFLAILVVLPVVLRPELGETREARRGRWPSVTPPSDVRSPA